MKPEICPEVGFACNGKDDGGFIMFFPNNYGVSVQFHEFARCQRKEKDAYLSPTAEVAVFDPDGEFICLPDFGWDEDELVVGWRTPDEVARIMAHVACLPSS